MRKTGIPALLFCIVVLLISCPDTPELQIGESTFWAYNFLSKKYYIVDANKLAVGAYCEIWADNGIGANNISVSTAEAERFADEYDNKIYQMIMENFDIGPITYTPESGVPKTFDRVMDFANYLGNGKLVVLLLDIKDGYNQNTSPSYTAGYFSSENFYYTRTSNLRNMIYVDTYPGKNNPNEMYSTVAHELQHLMNFVTSVAKRETVMDTWIDEGLATQAEFLYENKHPDIRLNWFLGKYTAQGLIKEGNNFFVWDNYPENTNAALDEYATAYLFFQWLYIQSGKTSALYKEIIGSSEIDHEAVVNVVRKLIPAWSDWDWERLLGTWLAANYLNAPVGEFGYKDAEDLKNISINPIGTRSANLYPGEAVYSKIKSSYTPISPSGTHIRYAGLTSSTVNFSGPPYTGDMLLTFNANTDKPRAEAGYEDPDNKGTREIGYLTGERVTGGTARLNIQRQAEELPAPMKIDHRDIAREFNAPRWPAHSLAGQ